MKTQVSAGLTAFALLFTPLIGRSLAGTYSVDYQGTGAGLISGGKLTLADKGTYVSGTFQLKDQANSFSDYLVFYIDSVPGTGFRDSGGLIDNAEGPISAITGNGPGGHSIRHFASSPSQFQADYAIALNPIQQGSLYQLETGTGSLVGCQQVRFTFNDQKQAFEFSVAWADIGVGSQDPHVLRFETLYATPFGSASSPTQSLEGVTGGGWSGVTFTSYDTFGVDPVPEMTTAALSIFGGLAAAASVVPACFRRARGWCRTA